MGKTMVIRDVIIRYCVLNPFEEKDRKCAGTPSGYRVGGGYAESIEDVV